MSSPAVWGLVRVLPVLCCWSALVGRLSVLECAFGGFLLLFALLHLFLLLRLFETYGAGIPPIPHIQASSTFNRVQTSTPKHTHECMLQRDAIGGTGATIASLCNKGTGATAQTTAGNPKRHTPRRRADQHKNGSTHIELLQDVSALISYCWSCCLFSQISGGGLVLNAPTTIVARPIALGKHKVRRVGRMHSYTRKIESWADIQTILNLAKMAPSTNHGHEHSMYLMPRPLPLSCPTALHQTDAHRIMLPTIASQPRNQRPKNNQPEPKQTNNCTHECSR